MNCVWRTLFRRRGVTRLARDHTDRAALAHTAERDLAGHQREQGVVTAAAHAGPGVEVRTTLAAADLARVDLLPAETLHAKPLCRGVTAVPAGRRALLVCHVSSAPLLGGTALRRTALRGAALRRADASDLQLGVVLPVAQAPPVPGLVLVLDHVDLGAGHRAQDLRCDLVAVKLGRVADDVAVIHDEQRRQGHTGTNVASKRVDGEYVVHRRLLLPATAAHDRVHRELALCLSRLGRGLMRPE